MKSKTKSRKRSLKTKIKHTLLDDLTPGHRITSRTALPGVSFAKLYDGEVLVVPMIMYCPECHKRHVDKGEFVTKQHHTHACQFCGMVWRPALVFTVGVQFLPGFKDGEVPVYKGIPIRMETDMKVTESVVR